MKKFALLFLKLYMRRSEMSGGWGLNDIPICLHSFNDKLPKCNEYSLFYNFHFLPF